METLVEKWEKLIEGKNSKGKQIMPAITETAMQGITAQLLENQEDWMIKNGLNEANSSFSSDIGSLTPLLMPIARRIIPNTIGHEIVGLQPMSASTGYAFAWRAHYAGSNTNEVGTTISPAERANSEAAATNSSWILVLADASGFSVGGDISGENSGVGEIEYKVGNTVIVQVTSGTFISGDAVDDADPFSAGLSTISALYPNEIQYSAIIPGYTGPYSTADGEVLGDEMPSIKTTMAKEAITAKTRKLKAEYTIEMIQDLRDMHGMNAEEELALILQSEILAETDRSLVNAVNGVAQSFGSWSYGTSNPATSLDGSKADARWEQERFRTIVTRILKASNSIYTSTRRGVGNFILCSPNVSTALEGLNNFMHSPVQSTIGPVGPYAKVGMLDGRIAVFVDTFASSDYVTVGYKGASKMDAGVIYCPYIPIMMSKVTHEKTFQPAIGVMNRSAISYSLFGSDTYYRKFSVDFSGSQLA